MSVQDLVQVGTELWMETKDITGVRGMESYEAGGYGDKPKVTMPRYTQITVRPDSFMGESTTSFLSSDWPVERVRDALGLVDLTEVKKLWDGLP
jgi:hypothetical protein